MVRIGRQNMLFAAKHGMHFGAVLKGAEREKALRRRKVFIYPT